MKPVLADAGFLVAAYNKREPYHSLCLRVYEALDNPLVTCEPVIAETLHLLRFTPGAADNILASVEEGLYAKKMGGGSVNPATGEFNFAVEEAYLIRNGQIGEPVRGATLIGRGLEILPLISMVGDDLELAAGMCGASSGQIPVNVGQPTLLVDSILVGGR